MVKLIYISPYGHIVNTYPQVVNKSCIKCTFTGTLSVFPHETKVSPICHQCHRFVRKSGTKSVTDLAPRYNLYGLPTICR